MSNKPNILFLMCDQLQGRVLDPESQCKTPNFDDLASQGTRFQYAYTPNAVCSPARASLMTGLLPHNHGVLHVTHTVDDDQSCLREDKPHWAQRLEQSGYRTGYFGKWHIERSNRLEDYGWQVNGESSSPLFKQKRELLAGDSKQQQALTMVNYNEGPPGYDGRNVLYAITDIEPEKRGMGIATSLAIDFLDDAVSEKQPWCCFVSVTEPHDPFICGKEAFLQYDVDSLKLPPNIHDDLNGRPGIYRKAARTWKNMTDRERREAIACYYGSITEIDQQFGRLIQKLRKSGQLENTIIVLTSDHGELLGAHGLYTKNISAAEEVYHIPLIVAGPEIQRGEVTNARVGLHDLCPTLLELTGCDPIEVPDSHSFAAILRSPKTEENNFQTGFSEYHGGRVLLTQRIVWNGLWKYIFNGFDVDELYNLEEDPYEMNNLINDPAYDGRLRQMSAQMWKVIKDTNDHSLLDSHYPSLRVASYGPFINVNKENP